MSFQIFGGETLMKWREPNAYVRKNFKASIIGFGVLLLIVFVVITIASHGQPVKAFKGFLIFSSILLSALLASWFLPGASVRLKEFCVQKAQGKSCNRSDYSKIESATVWQENYDGKIFSIIKFKIKVKFNPNEKSTWNTTLEKIVVPEDVNLEQVLQILRDKGVNVIEGQLPS